MAAEKSERRRSRERRFTCREAGLGQPLATLAAAIAEHADSASGAHPAQETVDAPAVPFLGLIGPFDRASVPDAQTLIGDTGPITSSCAGWPCGIHRPVLYSPPGSLRPNSSKHRSSTNYSSRSQQILQVSNT